MSITSPGSDPGPPAPVVAARADEEDGSDDEGGRGARSVACDDHHGVRHVVGVPGTAFGRRRVERVRSTSVRR
jgi:hypothetical protein